MGTVVVKPGQEEAQGKLYHSLLFLKGVDGQSSPRQPATGQEDTVLSCARGSSGWTLGKKSS